MRELFLLMQLDLLLRFSIDMTNLGSSFNFLCGILGESADPSLLLFLVVISGVDISEGLSRKSGLEVLRFLSSPKR